MPLLRYSENIGTNGNDVLHGSFRTIVLGGRGDDTIHTAAGQEEIGALGGSGNDHYVPGIGSVTTIMDTGNSPHDILHLPFISYFNPLVITLTIDDAHLLIYDANTDTQVALLDWLTNASKIESIAFSDTILVPDHIAGELHTLPNFLGNFSMEDSGVVPDGFSANDVRESINYYANRAAQIEVLPPASIAPVPSDSDDVMDGTSRNDVISALAGNDVINGADGDDWLQGNQGNDQLFGGNGNDTIYGGKDADLVQGNQGSDSVNGNNSNDTVYGGKGADTVRGGKDSDLVNGNNENDEVYGDLGDDTVHGGKADDLVFGGDGNDVLYGDLGNDTLNGGDGADIFVFNVNSGVDLVQDFQQGLDNLQIASSIFSTAADAVSAFNGGILDLGAGNTVTLQGIGTLTESDIIIV